MKMTVLESIADIRTGYTFRKAISLQDSTGLLGLQISDLRQKNVIESSALPAIQWPGKGRPPVLGLGDVVIVAKGSENNAAIFLDPKHRVVPSSQLLILTVKDTRQVSSKFLCWLLNSHETQRKISEFHSGTKIYSISKKDLQKIPVPVPELETQEKILSLACIFDDETRLTHALLRNREVMVREMSKKLLYGETK